MALKKSLRRLALLTATQLVLTVALALVAFATLRHEAERARQLRVQDAQRMLMLDIDRTTLALAAVARSRDAPAPLSEALRRDLATALSRLEANARSLRDGGTIVGPGGARLETAPATDREAADRAIEAWRRHAAVAAPLLRPSPTEADVRAAARAVLERSSNPPGSTSEPVEREGTSRPVPFSVVPALSLAVLACLLGVGAVVTARRMHGLDIERDDTLEEARRELVSLRLLSQVAASTTNMVLITDARQRIEWVNASFEQATGWCLDEIRGKTPGQTLHGDETNAGTIAFMRERLRRGEGVSGVEVVNYDRRGRPFWVEVDVQPVRDEDRQVRHFVVVQALVTERRRVQAELRQAHEAAEHASLAKSRFLARMSHELRTPLNGVLGLAQAMRAEASYMHPTHREYLKTIVRSGRHLLALIEDTMDLSRIEAGELKIERMPVDLVREAQAACEALEAGALESGVSIEHLGPGEAWVWGDRTRLRQVVLNLVSNAIKYNRAGGKVTLAIGRREHETELVVDDTGPGMSAWQVARLFEAYNRLGAENSTVPGTGIGLSIAHRLALMMQGRLTAESEPGRGTRFRLSLGAVEDEIDTTPGSISAFGELDAASGPAGRVLYVEDDEVNILVFQALLARRPRVELLIARDAQEGLRMALREKPDLVVADLRLPEGDGLSLLQAIRQADQGAHCELALLSADATPDTLERARDKGITRVWTKPIEFAPMLASIDEALRAATDSPR